MKPRATLSIVVIAATLWLSSPVFMTEFSAKSVPENISSKPQFLGPYGNPNTSTSGRDSTVGADENRFSAMSSSSLNDAKFKELVSRHGPMLFDAAVSAVSPAQFFKSTQSFVPAKFQLNIPKFIAGGACRRSSEELEKSFRTSLGQSDVALKSFIPGSVSIIDLNFYMAYRGKYYQLSLEPLSDTLDKYQLTLIQSSSEDFSADTERFVSGRLDPLQHYPSQDEALAELRKLILEYSEQGARWGTRTALLANKTGIQGASDVPLKDEKFFRVEVHDGNVRGFLNHQQECHLNVEGKLDCRCW
ncbi:MAG: hypothetical protein RI953_769 [Pseudomonadota bacterium]|jgi:hypothetical protein